VYRGHVYIIRYNGVLVVFDAKTGDKKYEQRLAGATNAFRVAGRQQRQSLRSERGRPGLRAQGRTDL
jgi:outer membrane protein assembly factor BamB